MGGFMIPQLIKNGYPEKYSIGLMTTSPNLGVIIPPSIGMILYSMISNVSLEGLFATGFIPGVLIMLGVCVYTYFIFRGKTEIVRQPVPSIRPGLERFQRGFLGPDAAGDYFRRYFFRGFHRQRGSGCGLCIRLCRRAVYLPIDEVGAGQIDHGQFCSDVGHPSDSRCRRHMLWPLADPGRYPRTNYGDGGLHHSISLCFSPGHERRCCWLSACSWISFPPP